MPDDDPHARGGVLTLEDANDFLAWRVCGNATVEIVDVAVGSERRKGRGRDLLRKLCDLVKTPRVRRLVADQEVWCVWAITRAENMIAQQWYEACGFYVEKVLRNFYSAHADRVDAIMYARDPRRPL